MKAKDAEITFDATLFAGGPVSIPVAASDLIIETNVVINGPDAEQLTIDGGDVRRIFQVISGGLDLSGVTLANGFGKGGDGGDGSGGGGGGLGAGGAIYIYGGNVTATSVVFADNHALGGDGGNGLFALVAGGGGGGVGDGVNADGQSSSGHTGGRGGPSVLSAGGAGGLAPFPNPGVAGGIGAGGGGGANSQFGLGIGGAGGFGGGGGGSGDAGSDATAASNGGAGGYGGGGGGSGWHSQNFPGLGGAGGAFAGAGGSTPAVQTDNGGGGGGAGLGGAVFVNDTASFTASGCTFSGNTAVGGLPGANRGGGALPGAGQGKGGTIFVRPGGTATLTNPNFNTNDAADSGNVLGDNHNVHGTVTVTLNTPLVVDTLDDTVDAIPGDFEALDSNGNTSLRAALTETNATGISAQVVFDPALFTSGSGVIDLQFGVMSIGGQDTQIEGPGAGLLTIDAGELSDIFAVNSTGLLTVSGMTLTRANVAINTFSSVVVEDVVFSDCAAPGGVGAAILCLSASITGRGCTFSGCNAGVGGAIFLNADPDNALIVHDSTFVDNHAEGGGGAIFVAEADRVVLANSTFSGNTSDGPGGAYQGPFSGTLQAVINCTFTGNRGDLDGDEGGYAGAIFTTDKIPLYNCIVAGNFSGPVGSPTEFTTPDIEAASTAAGGNNIIGSAAGITGGLEASSRDFDVLGITDISDLLSPLADNGGPTQTHALFLGSPALNTGDDALAIDPDSTLALEFDQRGAGFPRIEGSAVDIGAFELTADTVAPTVTVTQASGQADPTNSLPIAFEIVFSEPVTGFDEADLDISGAPGLAYTVTPINAAEYVVEVTAATGDGDISVSVPAGGALDTFGNANLASTSSDNTVSYDTTAPEAQLEGPTSNPIGGTSIAFSVTFDEPVFGFTSSDLVVTNGSGTINSGADGDTDFGITVVPTGDGLVTLQIPAGVCADAAGNLNAGPVSEARTYDGTAPVPVASSTAPSATNATPIAITVTFQEPVVDLIAGSLALTNATAVRTSGGAGASVYTFDLTPLAEGPVSARVFVGATTDPVGNSSAASNTLNFTYDITAPGAVIETTATSPTDIEPIPFTINFDEPVTGFSAGDLAVSNGNIANFAGSGAAYSFDVFPGNDGLVEVTLPAGAAQDLAGNGNTVAALALELVYDTVAPTVETIVRASGASLTNAATVDFNVEFSEAVTGVDATDFVVDAPGTLTEASIGGITGIGSSYIVTVNTGSGEGLLSIDVLADGSVLDAADRPLAAPFTSGEAYQVDRNAPTATLFSVAPDPTTETSIPITVNFSESVTGFVAGDLVLVNATIADFTGSGAAYNFSLVPSAGGEVSVQVPAGAALDLAGNDNAASAVLVRTYVDLTSCDTPFHTTDIDQDNVVTLSELLRAIQFYNSENFHCEAGTEDNYAPGVGDLNCCAHDSDYNPQNLVISLTELLRLIQFYNSLGYTHCPDQGTEDNFCPGTP